MGPHMDLTFRRRKSAAPEVQKMALRQPKATSDQPKKIKNIERGAMGDKYVLSHSHLHCMRVM